MIYGPDGLIYVGSEPPYGQLGGAIGVWDPKQNKTIENYRHLVTNQSIVSLAWEPKSGLIFGGSGNYGGGGTRPVEKEAKFFAFDPKKRRRCSRPRSRRGRGNYPATFAAERQGVHHRGRQAVCLRPGHAARSLQTVQPPGRAGRDIAGPASQTAGWSA